MKRPDIATPPNPKTPLGALHCLAANLSLRPADMIVHESRNSVEIITAHEDCQRRLVGKQGQNIKAMIQLAVWLGFRNLTLSEPDPRTKDLGAPAYHPKHGANLRESMAARAFFRDMASDLFEAAGCLASIDVGTDEAAGEIFIACTIQPEAKNQPDALTTAALSKILRGIAIRHQWEEISFSCE